MKFMLPSDVAFLRFAEFLARIVNPLTPTQRTLDALGQASYLRCYEKRQHLLRSGDIADCVYFVHSGLIRYYYLDDATGSERTGQFFDACSVYADVSSLVSGLPSRQFVQALERSEIVCIPQPALLKAYDDDHAIERFGRAMLQQALIGSQHRNYSIMARPIDERYVDFTRSRSELAGRVPQYIVASYLGVTPEAISRTRRRITRPE